jgi:ABC-type phosphate/phosphonate transport system substrate-binding protein
MIIDNATRTGRVVAGVALFLLLALPTAAEDRVTFIGVALDTETREADRRLRTYLARETDLSFAPEELEYAQVIERLVSWQHEDGIYLARTTPYAHVVSEMLGADLEVLATYIGAATGDSTYRAYFVAPKDALPPDPTPRDLVAWITGSRKRLRFVYHSRFSTSSFFLPSLFFRDNLIFHTDEPTESITAIEVARYPQNSSLALIEAVARGDTDFAAVWDGTRARFAESHRDPADRSRDREVVFVPLPSAIPNDLLVCSRWAPAELKERIRTAISTMPENEIAIGDFRHWVDMEEATAARSALARLRWLAREQPAPVTVDVRSAGGTRAATPEMLTAAKHAVRLSGMEFVLFDEDFHAHIDYVWTIERIHDGSARLRSTIPGAEITEQVFPISFNDTTDLTQRVVSLMQTSLHRIRSVWPYSGRQPMVIRDTTLALAPGAEVPIQRITWIDPERNSFRAGPLFSARVRESSMFVHEFEADDFLRVGMGAITLDPMSNLAFRVYETRQQPPNTMYRVATGALLGLLALAAAAAVAAVRKRRGSDRRFDEETLAS